MDAIANEIIKYMNKILSRTTYLGIFGENDRIYYMQGALKKYLPFLQSYIEENFNLLGIGDHSIPLSGVNLVFFKTSEHSIVVLHTREGPVGQLLAFKSRMFRFADRIEEQIIKTLPGKKKKKAKTHKVPSVSAERIPVLTVSIDKKKFPMDEASILHNINGEKTITEICKETKIPRLKVNEILKKYQKKGWVRLKRVIGSKKPKPTEAPPVIITKKVEKVKEVKKVTKPKPPPPKPIEITTPFQPEKPPVPFVAETKEVTAPITEKKEIPEFQPKGAEPEVFGEEIIYNFPILLVDEPKVKMSKNEQKILKMCDGRNTIEDICDIFSINKVELMSILRKFQKKGIIKLTRIIPSAMEETKTKILEEKATSLDEYDKKLVGELDQLIDKVEKKIEMRIEDEDPEKLVDKAIQKQAVPEEPIVTEEDFEETLTDLEKLLETTKTSSDSSEIDSFDDALTELSGLLDETSSKEESTEPIELEQPITESEITPTPEVEVKAVPKIKGAKVICQHCQAALPSTKRICPQCGNPVKICPHCSAPISIHTRICPDCSGIVN